MNIVFDLLHPADVNLFKNSIYALKSRGYNIFITYRFRGALERIAVSEFPDFLITRIGNHQKTFLRKVFFGLIREVETFFFFRRNKIDVVVCLGLACGISSKLLKIKIFHFDDDSEYRLTFYLGKWFSYKDIVPNFMPVDGSKFIKYKGFKELAYLHPDYFSPDPEFLKEFKIAPFEFVFIREISTVSVNYQRPNDLLNDIVNYLKKKNLKIVLSLEDKNLYNQFNNDCIILNEPVKNLYSLINYALMTISSGDTMARESCLLGTPCIYTGGRVMFANKQFVDMGIMSKTEVLKEIYETIDRLSERNFSNVLRTTMHQKVIKECDDTNKVLIDQIEELKRIS